MNKDFEDDVAIPEKVIRPTSVFGDTHNVRNPVKYRKQEYKCDLMCNKTEGYRFIDHSKTFAQRNKGQRGPARMEQTFLVSFLYKGAVSDDNDLFRFIDELSMEHGLQGHCESCTFRGLDAWQIIVADVEVVLDDAIKHARQLLLKNKK